VVAAVAAGTALSLYRNPGVGALDTTVMEDASVFLADQVNHGFLSALATPYSGYFHLLPRLLVGVAAVFPPDLAAAVMSVEAALVTTLLAVMVYFASAGLLHHRVQRLLVSVPMVVMPLAQVELFNEINMLRWQLMYATFWAALWVSGSRTGRAVAATVLVVAGMSDNVVGLFLPLLAIRVWARREPGPRRLDRTAVVGAAGLLVGALASVVSVVAHVSTRGVTPRLDPVWAVSAFVIRPVPQMMVGSRWVTESPAHTVAGLAPVAAGWLIVLTVIVVAAAGMTRPNWLLAAVSVTMAAVIYLYCIMVVGVAGPRYSAPAGMLILTAVVALLTPRPPGQVRRPWVPLAAFTAFFLLVCVINLRLDSWRSDGPRWSTELRHARAVCAQPGARAADLRVSPLFMGWSARLPCSYLRR
jgi:hypothetical protein